MLMNGQSKDDQPKRTSRTGKLQLTRSTEYAIQIKAFVQTLEERCGCHKVRLSITGDSIESA